MLFNVDIDTERLILFSWFGVLWLSAGVWWRLGEESLT